MLLGKYNVKVYKFGEFGKDELALVDKIIENIKENKIIYAKLVLTTALLLHMNMNAFATGFEDSLDSVGNQIINMLLSVAKWACIGMGTKNMITTMLNGGNIRQATTEGIQYFAGYLFIQFYPQLFDLFGKINFK